MDNHHSSLLLILCAVLAFIGVFIAVNFYIGKPGQSGGSKPIIPTFAEINPGPKTTTILAPNGKMNLIVKESKTKDTVTETFYSETDKTGQIQIYEEALPSGSSITVPFNTFSPDNKYIFLKKTTELGATYFVLKTDGTTFANDEKTVDFVSLFNQKFPDAPKAQDVTGWGGMNLIVVNTKKPDGSVERSYWYDVASNSFIPLSSRFN